MRGEIVLLISSQKVDVPAATAEPAARLLERVDELESQGSDSKQALKKAARELGIKRDDAYRIVSAQKKRRNK